MHLSPYMTKMIHELYDAEYETKDTDSTLFLFSGESRFISEDEQTLRIIQSSYKTF